MSITSITSNISARIAAGVLGLAVAFGFAFALTLPVQADTSMCPSYSWTRNLQVGSKGDDVMKLQQYLNSNAATMVASSGAGSPGSETSTFGGLTKAAVMKFQAANSISPVAGFVGPLTRAKINSMCAGTTGTTNPNPTPSAGTGLMVSAAAQPANGLAPAGTSRIPFTNFTVTAGNDGDVTINGVTVQRTGAAVDSNFSGVVLIDQSTGLQVGISKTLNSNHQATIGDTIVIPRGTSKTFTVAANRSAAGTHGGEVASFAVVSINTTAAVTGSLPITGASHTINETLSVGSVSTSTSAFDPGAAQTKNIGDTGIKFSGIRFTAGSGEDLKMYSARFRQVGSVSSSDIANVMINVNGVDYPTTIDSTGKYYTSTFPGGVFIAKGNSVDMYIKGDMVGSNAAARTADFDIDKVTDVYFVGQLYGYGIAPSGTATPWYNGYVFTINAGTATTIGKATEVPAQSVAVNLSNQPLGGFVADFKGEPVSVSAMIFRLSYSSVGASANLLTNVSLVDENGTVVAGPVDGIVVAGSQQTVTFTDSVTFKTGRHIYTLKGKIPSGVTNGQTIVASTTPSGWTSPVGQTSGNTISLSGQGVFSMNTMTVKTAALAITMSTSPASQSIVAGGQTITFANVQLDAAQSGEDVRISSLPIIMTAASGAVIGDLTSCQLWNGTTAVNTGSNVPSSLNTSGSATTFTFDNSLTVAKGTVTSLALKCNVSSSAASSGTYIWSISSGSTFSATGLVSGQSVTVSATSGNAGTMTVGSASLTIASDSSSPAYALATAGSSGVVLGVYKFHAANEAVVLNRIGLALGDVTASSTAADFDQTTSVTLWANGAQIGSATFTGSNRNATSTLSTVVTVPKDGDLVVTVKGNLAIQGPSEGSHPGALLTVDADTSGSTGNKNTQGTGASSGTTIGVASGSTSSAGVRVFKTIPTIALLNTGSATLIAQSGVTLYRFSVSANAAGPLAVNKFVINVATSSVSTTNGTTSVNSLKVFAYTDPTMVTSVAGFTNGQVVTTVTNLVAGDNTATISGSAGLTIPAGGTYYFKVTGDVTQVAGSTGSAGTVTTKLTGDSAYPSLATLMGVYAGGLGNFVWSPLSTTTTAATTNIDWTNGFTVPGLPSGGTDSFTLTK